MLHTISGACQGQCIPNHWPGISASVIWSNQTIIIIVFVIITDWRHRVCLPSEKVINLDLCDLCEKVSEVSANYIHGRICPRNSPYAIWTYSASSYAILVNKPGTFKRVDVTLSGHNAGSPKNIENFKAHASMMLFMLFGDKLKICLNAFNQFPILRLSVLSFDHPANNKKKKKKKKTFLKRCCNVLFWFW